VTIAAAARENGQLGQYPEPITLAPAGLPCSACWAGDAVVAAPEGLLCAPCWNARPLRWRARRAHRQPKKLDETAAHTGSQALNVS
jgi:hypothetical protein